MPDQVSSPTVSSAAKACATSTVSTAAPRAVAHQASAASATLESAVERATRWLATVTEQGAATPPSPIGLYFAKLWYYEALYPLIFAMAALSRVQQRFAR